VDYFWIEYHMTGILQAILSFFGVAPAAAANYIEDVFSTYLYTGNGTYTPNAGTNIIINGIDLAAKGGLVWCKDRNNVNNNVLLDSTRGGSKYLFSNNTDAQDTQTGYGITSFNSNGFTLQGNSYGENQNGRAIVSWTFREQAKFFDVVTYTGTGSVQNISHNLGAVPGCIVVKRTNSTGNWFVYHRSLGNGNVAQLNTTAAAFSANTWNYTTPTSTQFTVSGTGDAGLSGATYVAYLFAHDAGGFGAAGTDNVISCGSFTTDGSGNATVSLGYEPQWVMTKRTDAAGNWTIVDVMRGMTVNAGSTGNAGLYADSSGAEIAGVTLSPLPNATGMTYSNVGASRTFIYIAIRRGPMKTPTSGTSVFSPVARIGNGSNTTLTSAGFPVDLFINRDRAVGNSGLWPWYDRMRGKDLYLTSTATTADTTYTTGLTGFDAMSGVKVGVPLTPFLVNDSSVTYIDYNFRRAPGFFDVVCYTGTGVARTISHNLTVVPELMIVKARTATGGGVNPSWAVYSQATGNTKALFLDQTGTGSTSINFWNNTTPTASVFSVYQADATNASATPYVAYLFATVAGVSKVGSYTGTGTTLQVDCGFTAGSRFVMIKRTDSTGDWYVWDSARGIVAGNDPYLLLNSTAAEVTNTDYVDTSNAGFEISSTAPAAINANGGTYIFLAIA
jgi:hypothetical protein